MVLAGYCSFLQLYATQPLLPLLKQIFHASELAVSLTVTVPSLGVALGAPFAGMLADRIGRRPVIVWSAFLLALTAFATSTATSLPQLIFWRFWQGIVTPGVFSVTVAYIHDEWREGGAGRTVAAYISGTVAGGFSCRMLSGLVAAHAPWQRSFVVLGSLNLLLASAIWAWLPPETKPHERGPAVRWWKAVVAHLRNRELLATYLVGFCVLFSLVAAFTYITFHLAAAPYFAKACGVGIHLFCVPGRGGHYADGGAGDRSLRKSRGAGGGDHGGHRGNRSHVEPSSMDDRDGPGGLLERSVYRPGLGQRVRGRGGER